MQSTSLPPLYSAWIADALPGPVPDETRATCSDCAMCTAESPIRFEIKTKCCTYIPSIPNFLAGMILKQNEAVEVFESYLDRADIRPHGVRPHEEFTKQYHPASPLFGRNLNWRCPYYLEKEGGLCGIWQMRNARCATWFCKHLRGEISRSFWTAIETLLTSIEKSLSCWCIHELEAGSVEFREAFPFEIGKQPFATWIKQQAFYQMSIRTEWAWGKWFNREREFFIQAGSLVHPLTWQHVTAICGRGIAPLLENVLDSYETLQNTQFPETIRIASFEQTDVDESEVRIWNGNPYDTITLPKHTLRLLHRMSGRKIDEIKGEVPFDLLQKLINAGILI